MLSCGFKQMRHLNVLCLFLVILCLNLSSVAAYFQGCDHVFNLNLGYTYLESPYYPNTYPASTSCRYKFNAPQDHEIQANCTMEMIKGPNACSTEFFYVARDGDENLRDSEQFCGTGNFVRKSIFRSMVFAYLSQSSGSGFVGRFRCQLLVTKQACDCGWSVNTKIVNGQATNINEYPSMVALKTDEISPPFCGASIISHYFVLTAGHCAQMVPNPSDYIIKAGDHNLASSSETKYAATYRVAQVIIHPGYTTKPTMNNDIALLKTTTPIEWTRGVGPICLPTPASAGNTFAYTYADVIGWGTTSFAGPTSDVLQKITLLITDNQACQNVYSTTTIYPSQICTYDYAGSSKDSCQYDSGGPVIRRAARQYLLGCISFGNVCGQGAYATGVNTRISSYLTWIYETTGYSICTKEM